MSGTDVQEVSRGFEWTAWAGGGSGDYVEADRIVGGWARFRDEAERAAEDARKRLLEGR